MTTDHTPAEAGTGELAAIAEMLLDIAMSDDLASQGPSINALSLQLLGHRCSPSVVPGDTATEGGPPPVDSRGDWCNCLGGPQGPWHLLGETPYCPGGADPASPRGEAQGQGEDVFQASKRLYDERALPNVTDLDGLADMVWNLAPVEPLTERLVKARHVSWSLRALARERATEEVPDEPFGWQAAPRAVAPVGNVDRETLALAFMRANVIPTVDADGSAYLDTPDHPEARRLADVALTALQGES